MRAGCGASSNEIDANPLAAGSCKEAAVCRVSRGPLHEALLVIPTRLMIGESRTENLRGPAHVPEMQMQIQKVMACPIKNATLAQFIASRSVNKGLRLAGGRVFSPASPLLLTRSRFGLLCCIFFRTRHCGSSCSFLSTCKQRLIPRLLDG